MCVCGIQLAYVCVCVFVCECVPGTVTELSVNPPNQKNLVPVVCSQIVGLQIKSFNFYEFPV